MRPPMRPPVETGGWNFGKSAFADCGGGMGAEGQASARPLAPPGLKSAFADCTPTPLVRSPFARELMPQPRAVARLPVVVAADSCAG
jgi:hypothetical protein